MGAIDKKRLVLLPVGRVRQVLTWCSRTPLECVRLINAVVLQPLEQNLTINYPCRHLCTYTNVMSVISEPNLRTILSAKTMIFGGYDGKFICLGFLPFLLL